MIARVRVGQAELIALSDAEEPADVRMVYPGATDEDLRPYRDMLTERGDIILNFGSYAIRSAGRTVLVDTGWGPSHSGTLLEELVEAGLAAEEFDAVVFTHLHDDHIGWNIDEASGSPRPRFPRARYVVPDADYRHYAAHARPASLFHSQIAPLERLGVMDLVGGDYSLAPGVVTVSTPGHTPGHLSIAVESGGERAFVLGDVGITAIEAEHTDWPTTWDGDPAMTVATRLAAFERLEAERTLVAAGHFPRPGFGYLTRRDGRRMWTPL